MKETVKKVIKYIIGWSLIILGVVGLFLPVLQGIAFIIAGLVILENKYILEWLKRIKERWHKRK